MRLPEIVILVVLLFTSVCNGGDHYLYPHEDEQYTETDHCKDKIRNNSSNFVYGRYNEELRDGDGEAKKYLNKITGSDCLDLISPPVLTNLLNETHRTIRHPKFSNKCHVLGMLKDNELDFATSLIEKGADVNDGTRTPFHEATQRGQVQLVKLFLDNGADIHKKCKSECAYLPNGTALHIAAYNRNIEMFELLLDHGADWMAITDWKQTPLHCVPYEKMNPQFGEAVKNHVETLRKRLKDTLKAQNDMNKKVAPEQVDLTEEGIHEIFFPTPKKKEEEMQEEMEEEVEEKKEKSLLQRAKHIFGGLGGRKN